MVVVSSLLIKTLLMLNLIIMMFPICLGKRSYPKRFITTNPCCDKSVWEEGVKHAVRVPTRSHVLGWLGMSSASESDFPKLLWEMPFRRNAPEACLNGCKNLTMCFIVSFKRSGISKANLIFTVFWKCWECCAHCEHVACLCTFPKQYSATHANIANHSDMKLYLSLRVVICTVYRNTETHVKKVKEHW